LRDFARMTERQAKTSSGNPRLLPSLNKLIPQLKYKSVGIDMWRINT
jgi:hypothetical protein